MNTQEKIQIKPETLLKVLNNMMSVRVVSADYESIQLHGGTLGDVWLVTGEAKTADGNMLPYRFVLKKQKRWERYGDSYSWRREYDLYASNLGKLFSDSLRWPKCYYAEMNEDEFQIWIEYVDGISGNNLTVDMYEFAAKELDDFKVSCTQNSQKYYRPYLI